MQPKEESGKKKKRKEKRGKKERKHLGEKTQKPKESALGGMSECAQEFMRTRLRDLKAKKTKNERSSLLWFATECCRQ